MTDAIRNTDAAKRLKEIADIASTTPNTVRVALVSIRKIEKEKGRPMRFPREANSDE